jgi:hypothetical protein
MKNDHDLINKQKRYVFLDDFRNPENCIEYMKLPIYSELKWTIVRNYNEFILDTTINGVADIYSFDHDLADEHYNKEIVKGENYHKIVDNYKEIYDLFDEKTGYHCALWLINYCIDNKKELPNEIYIHSMNPAGSMNIKSLFDSYNKIRKSGNTEIYMLPSNRR